MTEHYGSLPQAPGAGFIPIRIKRGSRGRPGPRLLILILKELYQKTGGLVVTYFPYFLYFLNRGRFFSVLIDLTGSSALKSGQPKGCPYIVVCLCRDRVYPVRGLEGQVVYTERVYIWVVGVAPDPDSF